MVQGDFGHVERSVGRLKMVVGCPRWFALRDV